MFGEWYLGWRTRDQVLKLYNNNSTTVDNMLSKKRSQGLVMDHPDNPDDEAMQLYWVPFLIVCKLIQITIL